MTCSQSFHNELNDTGDWKRRPHYDDGEYAHSKMTGSPSAGDLRRVYRSAMLVGIPLVEENETFMSSDVRVRLRVNCPYETYAVNGVNASYPQEEFGMGELATSVEDQTTGEYDLTVIN